MNQKEAIELALEMHAECEKRDATGCRGCPFLLEDTDGYQESFCSITDIEEIGTERLTERLRQLDSSCVPSDKVSENVNHPSHYTQGGIECIEAIKAATVNLTGIEAVCTANAIKYLWRWKDKNGAEDLNKAIWYIKKLIKEESENGAKRVSGES